jgi:hypothetical protein
MGMGDANKAFHPFTMQVSNFHQPFEVGQDQYPWPDIYS